VMGRRWEEMGGDGRRWAGDGEEMGRRWEEMGRRVMGDGRVGDGRGVGVGMGVWGWERHSCRVADGRR
jgi:hypothetical protein